MAIAVYWRNHKVGQYNRPMTVGNDDAIKANGSWIVPDVVVMEIPRHHDIKTVSEMPNMEFDRDFKDLFGITGQ